MSNVRVITARERLDTLLHTLISSHHKTHRLDEAWSLCPDPLCQQTTVALRIHQRP